MGCGGEGESFKETKTYQNHHKVIIPEAFFHAINSVNPIIKYDVSALCLATGRKSSCCEAWVKTVEGNSICSHAKSVSLSALTNRSADRCPDPQTVFYSPRDIVGSEKDLRESLTATSPTSCSGSLTTEAILQILHEICSSGPTKRG